MRSAVKFTPVAILKNGILFIDGKMAYTDSNNRWLFVSEDGMNAVMYNDAAQLIRDMYKQYGDDDDFVVTGWDMEITRFNDYDEKYNYYNKRFED